ncbi:MAG: hypothetical protein U0517_04040 [Candidatus Andersenbacteria bacterium]
MAEVTLIENRHKRAKNFWTGFVIGVVFMLIGVAVFWFLGLIDIFPAPKAAEPTRNNAIVTNETSTESNTQNNLTNSTNNTDTTENNTANEANTTDNNTTKTTNTTGSSSAGVTLTVAKNVDDSAKPVDPTDQFSADDDRFYVIVEFDSTIDLGKDATVSVEWFKNDAHLSDFDYDLPENQTRVYFYQNNAGVGDYEVAISLNGKEIGREAFTVGN